MSDGEMSSVRQGWFIYAIIMLMVYPFGIPFLFAVLLWRERYSLCPHLEEHGIRYLFVRHPSWLTDKESRGKESILSFLASSYQPNTFWFEVVECYRRLLLSSMLILFSDGSTAQIVVAMLLNLLSIKIYSYYLPFADDSDDTLAEIAQWQLFCVFFAALLIRVDVTGELPGGVVGVITECDDDMAPSSLDPGGEAASSCRAAALERSDARCS